VCVCVCVICKFVRVCECACETTRKRTDQGHDIGFWLGPKDTSPLHPRDRFFFRLSALSCVITELYGWGGGALSFTIIVFLLRPKNEIRLQFYFFIILIYFYYTILPTRSPPPPPEQQTTFGFPFIHHFRFKFFLLRRPRASPPRHNLILAAAACI